MNADTAVIAALLALAASGYIIRLGLLQAVNPDHRLTVAQAIIAAASAAFIVGAAWAVGPL